MTAEAGETPEINSALLSLIIIFIPGILCYGIVAALAERKDRDNVTMIVQVFMYGVVSYLALWVAHSLRPNFFPGVDSIAILNPSAIERSPINPRVIGFASLFGLVQGIIITLNLNYTIMLRVLKWIRLTNRFGDQDVWTLLLNSTRTNNWVTIRYKEPKLIYQGYVSGFSTGAEARELLLVEVCVYDGDSMESVGKIPFLYLSFDEKDVTLEFGEEDRHSRKHWWQRT